jgi:sigma-E factor negative regulatory protein RseA
MEKISALMDSESGDQESAAQLARLRHEPELRRAWDTYHLIGESLRGEASLPGTDFMGRFSAALAQEPTVLAPRAPVKHRGLARVALPLAASFAGVALVGWLAISGMSPDKPTGVGAVATVKPDDGAARDYITAHQGAVRPVTAREADLR